MDVYLSLSINKIKPAGLPEILFSYFNGKAPRHPKYCCRSPKRGSPINGVFPKWK